MNSRPEYVATLARAWKSSRQTIHRLATVATVLICAPELYAQVAIHGDTVYTMSGAPIQDAIVVIKAGKVAVIGKAADVKVPEGFEILKAKVVTPGLIDAHTTVGFSGIWNVDADQDQLERSQPVQPELRAIDAFNTDEELIKWIRSYGVTTIHAGHGPGELVSGQTLIAKTTGNTAEEAILVPAKTVSVTLTLPARKTDGKSPGTRGKMVAMLRAELIKATEYARKHEAKSTDDEVESDEDTPPPTRDLRLEALAKVLSGELTLMVTADRAQDIANALRLAKEFDLKIWLDGAAESYLLVDEIRAAGVPVLIHPTMTRATGERVNLSFETASKLVAAEIPVALQSGYEAYVPKTRVVLFEAGMAAANGLTFEQALATITVDAAKILGVDDQVGSLEVGKDGDVALYDGDPFEYTTHCIGVVIDGNVVSRDER